MAIIQLLDINTGIVHNIEVSEEDAKRANEGIFHWPHEAILLLLASYAKHEHEIKSGKISMKKFWNIIASELNKGGYNVTDVQCKSKMTGMKNTYKSIKDHNQKSGNNPRKWQYFDIIDKQFNNKPWVAPVLTLDSSNPTPLSEITNIKPEKRSSSCTSEMPSKRIKQFTLLEKVITVTEENTAQRQKMHEEAMARQDRLLDILEKMITKQ